MGPAQVAALADIFHIDLFLEKILHLLRDLPLFFFGLSDSEPLLDESPDLKTLNLAHPVLQALVELDSVFDFSKG